MLDNKTLRFGLYIFLARESAKQQQWGKETENQVVVAWCNFKLAESEEAHVFYDESICSSQEW